MARLQDSNGNMLGGLHQSDDAHHFDQTGTTPEAAAVAATAPPPKAPSLPYVPPHSSASLLKRRFALEEIVPGLLCSYGTFAHSFANTPSANQGSGAPGSDDCGTAQRFAKRGCHNPVQSPRERYHCGDCSGDYCQSHSVPTAHDCEFVVQPQR